MKTLFYCHHGLGIGHLVRTLQLADAILELGSVAVIVGGELPAGLPVSPRITIVELAALQMDLAGGLHANGSSACLDAVMAARTEQAEQFVHAYCPDVVIVEMFPFGRKKLAGEIQALVRAARANGARAVFSSVRDILVTGRADQEKYDARAVRWLNEDFDALLVHGDKNLLELDATFSKMSEVKIPVHYTGYVSRPSADAVDDHDRVARIVVSAGGGRVGEQLLQASIDAYRQLDCASTMEMTILAGPLVRRKVDPGASTPGLTLKDFEPNLPDLLAQSWVSVSQAGYNTVTDVLQTGTPAVLVPFETPSEDEQLRRARCLEELDRARLVRQQDLTPKRLAEAIASLPRKRYASSIDLNGVPNTRRFVMEWCGGR